MNHAPTGAADGPTLLQVREPGGEVREAGEVVGGEEVVEVGEGGLDAGGQGLVVGKAEEGAQPDQAEAASLKAGQLGAEELGFAAVPAVANDQRDRAVGEDAACPG